MSQDRTEKPTPKRLKDSRAKGQVARSRDLALAAASIASIVAFAWLGDRMMGTLGDLTRQSLAALGDNPLRTVTAGELTALVTELTLQLGLICGPLALATMVAAIGMHGFQSGWSVATEALGLHWERLSPMAGLRRFAFKQSGVETLKAMVAFVAIGYFTWGSIEALALEAPSLAWMSPSEAAAHTWDRAQSLLWRAAWTLAVIALADYGVQRYFHLNSLKMTRQEVRDEHRQAEGSGEVKGRMRRLQQAVAQRRMLKDVPRATVVITNPTHFAVAIEYHRETMSAPRVLAKGADHMARRIREIALESGVPIVENKPLAQSLYANAEIGEVIPSELFAAVAEVLAYLVRIKRLML